MRQSGVYRIRHWDSGRSYIGSSVSIQQRWIQHLSLLRRGKHPLRALQSDWTFYGEPSFLFEIVEECTSDMLIAREQWWLDQASKLYNRAPMAGSPKGVKLSPETRARQSVAKKGVPFTAEHRAKISAALMGHPGAQLGRPHTAEARAKMSVSKKGYRHSPEARAKMSASRRGVKSTDATRAILSAAQKARWKRFREGG